MTNTTALAGKHDPVPLPFADGSLKGLSEKLISSHLENDYGCPVRNLNAVEQELQPMRATGMGLEGGSGWAILAVASNTGALRTFSSGNHTQALATSVPLLVIDAFFADVNWEVVNRRLDKARRMSAIFRGAGS